MPTEISDPGALYLDASALVKLVLRERETEALRLFIRKRTVLSSELAIAEVPRAVARSDRAASTGQAVGALLTAIGLLAITPLVLARAAAYDAPGLCTLDAIHVASAQDAEASIDHFVSYDRRQVTAVERVGLSVRSPA